MQLITILLESFIDMQNIFRPSGRASNQLREIKITRNFTCHAEGSVLIEFGATKVICTASVEENVPQFLKGRGQGWVTAEYAMLPRATHTRNKRDGNSNKPNSRGQEISRLIGRSLRSAVDLTLLGERQIIIDCDVIQADGGTRTASITGAMVAFHDAVAGLLRQQKLAVNPLKKFIAAISVGVYQGQCVLDLDYPEDSNCDSDINVVMDEAGGVIEIQGTAEGATFSRQSLNQMLDFAEVGISELIRLQKQSLALT